MCVCVCVYVCVFVPQSSPALCDPMDCSPPDSSIHGILQARTLKWAAIPFSRGLPYPGIKRRSPASQADSLPSEPPGKFIGDREPGYKKKKKHNIVPTHGVRLELYE